MVPENNKILIFGKNSFVASGINSELLSSGFEPEFFTRGNEGRIDNTITGEIFNIKANPYFEAEYDAVINYIVLKDIGIDENINYIKQLLEFCKQHQVKKLIHFSSIMVFSYSEKNVKEDTPIEPLNKTNKKGYGEIKIAVDEYLLSVKEQYDFEIIIVRPGYVLADDRPCPFVKQFPLGIYLIKGNKKSKQPIVSRDNIHKAMVRILSTEKNDEVYHLFPDNDQTKYLFAKQHYKGIFLFLPELLFNGIPYILMKFNIFPKSLYSRFEGMYIKTVFSSKRTEEKLQIKF